jgi:RNA polymerase sigma-70 factor (ECF subfamily)
VHLTITELPEQHALGVVDADLPLVNASRQGDVSAFEELVNKYDRKLYRIAESIMHNHEDAEEVVQTAFLKAYQNLDRFQGDAKFSSWLVRIAMNESFMRLRRLRSHREQPLDKYTGRHSEQSETRFLQHRFNLSDWATNPESLYSATELRQILEKSLEKLQPALRVVFILRDIEEHSASDISEMLSLSPTALRSRLSRARLRLREELSHYFNKQS